MYIEITTLDGKHVTNVSTDPLNLANTIERVKQQYPKENYHATLVTY